MNAIELLKQQHREVEELFEEYESAGENARKTKQRAARRIADALAIHAELEEKIFYPEARQAAGDAEDLLREAVEEHLAVKKLLADILQATPEDPQLDAKLTVLKEQVEHHVEEEEQELFPKVKKACSKEELEDMGERMEQLAEKLEQEGDPSRSIPDQTDAPSQL